MFPRQPSRTTLYSSMPCLARRQSQMAISGNRLWLTLDYVTKSILSRPSASGCFPLGIGLGAENGFAFGRNSMVMSMTTRKAESATVQNKSVYSDNKRTPYAPTDFRILSHLTLSMSVRKSPSSIMALFMSSYVHVFGIQHCTRG